MGQFLAKQWNNQGYYVDMVEGYVSRGGGFPRMIRFPKELQRLKEVCPKCKSNKDLVWEEMNRRLKIERRRFRNHMEKCIKERVANGERCPYPNYDGGKGFKGGTHPLIHFRFKTQQAVTPSTPVAEVNEQFHFPIDGDDLVVCKCMKSSSDDQQEDFNEEEAPPFHKNKNVKEGRELDFCDVQTSDQKLQTKANDFKAAGESTSQYFGDAGL